jgi:hypothetical protein
MTKSSPQLTRFTQLVADLSAKPRVSNDAPGRRPHLLDWAERHNLAITEWARSSDFSPAGEVAILGLADGIDAWVRLSGHGDDGLLGIEVTVRLLWAFGHALNGNIGRLDAATLSAWSAKVAADCDLDLDTGTWAATKAPIARANCPECGRSFDLADETDADEFYNGHDCEVAK